MSDDKKYTITLTAAERDTMMEGLCDTIYWRSDEHYRRDAVAHPPYSDDRETRETVELAVNRLSALGHAVPDE